MIVFWFRRDLRIDDNIALHEAIATGQEVLPIFIFDRNILVELPEDDARVTFIMSLLEGVNAQFKQHSRSLAVFYDTPENVFKMLLKDYNITALYANRDYEPYARTRDKAVYEMLLAKDIPFKSFKDQVIFEKSEVVKDNGEPYSVYTPYKNRWHLHFKQLDIKVHQPQIEAKHFVKHDYPFLNLKDIGFVESGIKPEPYNVLPSLIEDYENTRNYPAIKGTSMLSPYLRFGALSIRQLVKKAVAANNQTFLNELIWREFFMQLLWYYPETVTKAFKPKYDNVKWRNSEADFKAWCEGKTGYPIVDAGMRELNATGHMHNRVRMVTASFLCKQLLLDWRKGEAYFAQKLLDYEQSSNVGNWQWAASSGADASPYFRIFNPDEQVRKFDKDLRYIKKWVPEFQDIDYKPIADYKESRERALKVYKEAVAG